jgi:hypothetical protein
MDSGDASGSREDDAQHPAGRYIRTGLPREILVDPAISRAKFERELAAYNEIAADQRQLGWWILAADFPEVFVVFVGPQLRPPAVLFGAVLDFTNYDLWPPSVTIVNPFTVEPLAMREIPAQLRMGRRVQQMLEVPGLGQVPGEIEQQLLAAHGPDDLPFFCIPGVREYHEHPAHTGDDWLSHRARGEGTLYFLLEKLYRYGAEPIKGYQLGLHIAGFVRPEAPQ